MNHDGQSLAILILPLAAFVKDSAWVSGSALPSAKSKDKVSTTLVDFIMQSAEEKK